jgi:general secretion pathway protein G
MKGFSYIELIVSVAILALLATAATPYLEKTIKREKEADLRRELRIIRTAIDQYKKAYDEGRITKVLGASGYPPNLDVLVNGVPNITDPNKTKMRFLRRIPADPMYASSEGEQVAPSATWGKRSYDSEADNPREGVDVFDVYSLSEQNGLNGIPYREW